MQSNIFEIIDLLVNMSGSKSNLDELKAELDDTEKRIEKTTKKLENFEQEMTDDKYFDASSEIVDRNIKISLVKKIQKINRVKHDLEKELDIVKGDEVLIHRELEDIRDEISAANNYNNIINNNVSENESYTNMVASENDRISRLISKKEELEEKYSKVQKKVEYLALSLEEANDKIEKEESRLKEVEDNLSNIRAYIDVEEKEKDENKYISIKNDLDDLIKHKDDILNDAVYIAGIIKEKIANEDKSGIDEEFEHLVNIVKEIPYMELENDQLESEKNKLDEELKSFDESISNKKYQTMDKEFIEERIKYLDEILKKINSRIQDLSNRKNELIGENDLLSVKIYNAEKQIKNIDNSLIDYESYDYESEELPKSVVQASNNKLIEEKNNISEITNNYREDLVNNISEIKLIEENLDALNSEINSKEIELDELNKKLALNTKSTNILEEEKDKIQLEKINAKITSLSNREGYSKSVSEIVDEFEMLMSSLEFADKKTRNDNLIDNIKIDEVNIEPEEKKIEDVTLNTEDFNLESKKVEINNLPTAKVEEAIEPEEKLIPESDDVADEDEAIFPFIPDDIPKEEKKEEKLRVVEVVPISDDEVTESENNDFMVNDFQDDDYVDLNTAFTTLEEN